MRFDVRVITKAKKERITEFGQGLKVYVRAPAIEGRANERLIELLSKYLNVSKSRIEIIKGQSSRSKVIEIEAGV
jgi:uncharacterized protein